MKITILNLLVLLSIFSTYSQQGFEPGFIITIQGDTVKGFILSSDKKLYSECAFKINEASIPEVYRPFQIQSYRFEDGKYYISKEVKLGIDSNKVQFLEYLIKGKASIYYFRDTDDHYFIETEKYGLIELTEEEKIAYTDEGTKYIRSKVFEGKLKVFFSDCPEIYPKIEKVHLDHKHLINLARDYHTKVCKGEECLVLNKNLILLILILVYTLVLCKTRLILIKGFILISTQVD
ncbi:MAG: hypothetical protein HC906_02575 [Bacteroidales bacterium]|nr:hypothetical protein [Bacteroidales bacterium]